MRSGVPYDGASNKARPISSPMQKYRPGQQQLPAQSVHIAMRFLFVLYAALTTCTKAQVLQCLPKAQTVQVVSTLNSPLAMLELQVMDSNGVTNFADPSISPYAVVSQSSTYKEDSTKFGASNAIDGDNTTFSMTQNSSDRVNWWEIDLMNPQLIGKVIIYNRFCARNDMEGCSCRLTGARVRLRDGNGAVVASDLLGDTCNQTEAVVEFTPNEKYCDNSELTRQQFDIAPSYSPTYLPSAQPVATTAASIAAQDTGGQAVPSYSPTYLPSAQPVATTAASIAAQDTGGQTLPSYSPTYLPSAQPVGDAVNDKFFGNAYSEGEVCADDESFISNKGITCKSFVYAETVHCRSSTGMHDEDFNALRYSDFCPKTCGMCVDPSALTVDANEEINTKGIAIGIGLSVSLLAVSLIAWICCRSNYTGKTNDMVLSTGTSNPTEEVVGVQKPPHKEQTDGEKIAESIGETIAKTDIV